MTEATGDVPHAPWRLVGECVLGWVPVRRAPSLVLPDGVRPLPGFAAVAACRYEQSPVGPYSELAVAVPGRIGLRPGLCVLTQAVSSPQARLGYRSNWGLPTELGTLEWSGDADRRLLHWRERGITVEADAVRMAIPVLVPVRTVGRRVDGPVVVPRRFWGLLRLARVDVTVPGDDPSVWIAGSHAGALVTAMRMVAQPARRPAGALSSLRAPLRAPEPATLGRVRPTSR